MKVFEIKIQRSLQRAINNSFTKHIALFIITIFSCITSWSQTNNGDQSASFKVFGKCVECKERIENALKLKGVDSADWNVETKMLVVVYDPSKINLKKIQTKILAAGHDLATSKASDASYNLLPACCLYRDTDDHDHVHPVSGIVVSEDNKGNFSPLEGASISWSGSKSGTLSDKKGLFIMPKNENNAKLVVSYTGFQTDSIEISGTGQLQIVLASNVQLKGITIKGRPKFSYINELGAIRNLTINSGDLLKAACCNLSESFETNPSVDVSYSDAVTGAKQIQLLGLAGVYTQLTVENLPGPRGLATPLGLSSIAGPWIESIQLSKGTGSVANGFESIAGQINVELKNPETSEK